MYRINLYQVREAYKTINHKPLYDNIYEEGRSCPLVAMAIHHGYSEEYAQNMRDLRNCWDYWNTEKDYMEFLAIKLDISRYYLQGFAIGFDLCNENWEEIGIDKSDPKMFRLGSKDGHFIGRRLKN